MPTRLKALREQAGELNRQIQAKAALIGQEGREWTAEDETEWKRLNAEYDGVADQVDRLERALEVDRRMTEPAGDRRIGRDDVDPEGDGDGKKRRKKTAPDEATDAHRSLAFRAWLRCGADREPTRRQVEACQRLGFNPRGRRLQIDLLRTSEMGALAAELRDLHPHRQRRALSAITGSAGGVTVPAGFLRQLEQNMLFYGPALQEITTIRTENGAPLPMPTADDTSNEGEIVGESQDLDGSTDPTFGAKVLYAHKISSKMVKIPTELIEDGAFDVEGYVGSILGERIGRLKNRKVTLGTGVKQPRGYLVDAALGVTAASATAITGDELTIDLPHSIEPAYREGATYALHDGVLVHVRKLKDGNGRPLFQSNLAEGFPDTIDGKRFWINQHMDSTVATGNKTVAFGNFRKYVAREVRAVRLLRLAERYAEKDQIAFLMLVRFDGLLMHAGTVPIKYLQQA